ncbi:hypothetical protein Hanom_Chr04g00283471 [Helianthus anomalus]
MSVVLLISVCLLQRDKSRDLSFCPPVFVGKETRVTERQEPIHKLSMLSGQQQRSMFLQCQTSKILRDDKRLLTKLSSAFSFSPKLIKSEQLYTYNSFRFTRTLLASASDSHK